MKVAALAQGAPQCWQAWPQYPGSSVWPHPTTRLSLLPRPSPGTSSEGSAASRQAGSWCSPKGSPWLCLASSARGSQGRCCLLRERAALLGAGHPRALCSFNPPRTRAEPCSVTVVSGHLQALAPDPRPCSQCRFPVATGSGEINDFL